MSRSLNQLLIGLAAEGLKARLADKPPLVTSPQKATSKAKAMQMPISTANFMNLVTHWADANINRMRMVWPLAGGWEAWAQAEIAGYVNANVQDAWIEREAYVYPNRSRADFLVNNPFQNPSHDEIVVEMKCESFGNWDAFVNGLRYDAWKLGGPMGMGLGDAKKIALGIFFSPESEQRLAMLHGFHIHYSPNREIGVAALIF